MLAFLEVRALGENALLTLMHMPKLGSCTAMVSLPANASLAHVKSRHVGTVPASALQN